MHSPVHSQLEGAERLRGWLCRRAAVRRPELLIVNQSTVLIVYSSAYKLTGPWTPALGALIVLT